MARSGCHSSSTGLHQDSSVREGELVLMIRLRFVAYRRRSTLLRAGIDIAAVRCRLQSQTFCVKRYTMKYDVEDEEPVV